MDSMSYINRSFNEINENMPIILLNRTYAMMNPTYVLISNYSYTKATAIGTTTTALLNYLPVS